LTLTLISFLSLDCVSTMTDQGRAAPTP